MHVAAGSRHGLRRRISCSRSWTAAFRGLTMVLPDVLGTRVGRLVAPEFADPHRLAALVVSRLVRFAANRWAAGSAVGGGVAGGRQAAPPCCALRRRSLARC
jgi:hypothetical protein